MSKNGARSRSLTMLRKSIAAGWLNDHGKAGYRTSGSCRRACPFSSESILHALPVRLVRSEG